MPDHDSERPVPPRPRSTSHGDDQKDPLWQAHTTLAKEVASVLPRLTAVEVLAKKAHDIAIEAKTSTDMAHRDFTAAIQSQTSALKTLGTSLAGVRAIGVWLVILICIMAFGTFATLVVVLVR